jgi:outer membrane protein assembly factor BamB
MLKSVACFVLLCLSARAGDWPRFRGPNGTGVDSTSTGLPVDFHPSKGVVWKTAVPFGRSSPIVAGGRLFLTASEGDRLLTFCYDARDGKLLWRREAANVHRQKTYKANDPASASVAVDGTGVYAFFGDLGLIAYSHEGTELWRHPLGPFDNFYGMASSPIVEGDLVIILCDDNASPFLLAVDKNTGRERWRVARPGMVMAWSVPIVYRPAGGEAQLIVMGTTRIDAYYLASGERRWWFPFGSEGAIGTPLLHKDSLIVFGLGQEGSVVPPFESVLATHDKDKDGRLSHTEFQDFKDWEEHFGWIDANKDGFIDSAEWKKVASFMDVKDYGVVSLKPGSATGQLPASAATWRVKRNLPYVPSPVLYKGVYFMVRDGGIVTALSPDTGAILKQGRAANSLGPYFASPVAADGKVFLLSEEGKLTVLKGEAQWEVLGVNDLGEEAYATPAIAGNRIYVRTRSTLYCFGSK